VRPEEVAMSREIGQARATVDKKMFLGDAIEYVVLFDGQALRVSTAPSEDFAVGERVYLSFKKYHFFD
jgi:hypothetical protein